MPTTPSSPSNFESTSLGYLDESDFRDVQFRMFDLREGYLYTGLRFFVRVWIKLLFHDIRERGIQNVPRKGPILLCMNHPNNLIDSVLVGHFVHRKIHYLATAQLFKNKMVATILKSLGAIPVYRKEDLKIDSSTIEDPASNSQKITAKDKNVQSFSKCYEVLQQGGVIGIYPEGTTHSERRVKKIKTGAARIVLEAEDLNRYGLGIKVVPIGLTFAHRKSFRQDVIISFGSPILLDPYFQMYRQDPVKGVEVLTEEIQIRMKEQIVHVEKVDLDELVTEIEKIYKGELIRDLLDMKGLEIAQVDLLRLSRKISEAVQWYSEKYPEAVQEMWGKIYRYKRKLSKLHLRDQLVQRELKKGVPVRQYIQTALIGILAFPIALYGLINNIFAYWLPRFVSRKIARKETDYATTKLIATMIAVPIFYSVQMFLFWNWFGRIPGLIYGASLPLSGVFAAKYRENWHRFEENIYFAYFYLIKRSVIVKMKGERMRILNEIEKLRDQYVDQTAET